MGSASTSFADGLDGASTHLISELGKASSAFADGLEESTGAITGRFEQTTGSLVDRIDDASKLLEDRGNATYHRLDDASAKFTKHIETANEFLSSKLSESADALDERLDNASTQLTGRLETSSTRISDRLSEVGSVVERSVNRFNEGIENVLTSRQDILGDLTSQLADKAADVDGMMRNYMSLIEDSLSNAHTRGEEIAKLISSQTTDAAKSFEEEIRRLEETSDAQISQTARALRDQHENVMASMRQMLQATNQEFADTAQDMRIMAQKVVKEVDSARSELKRSILELPEETRTNADAMRRVVSDQITALSALGDIVKRQSAVLDLSGPGIYLPPDEKETGPGKAKGAPSAASLMQTPVARRTQTTRSTGEMQATISEPLALRGRPVEDLVNIKTTKASANLLPALEADIGTHSNLKKNNGSKVSKRSTSETEKLVTKLNSAARGIVEALEDDLPGKLESKFNSGEVHVYTHHLYRQLGNKLQQDIKTRYRSVRLVRGRVDAFIRLFERLLDTVAESANGEDVIDACLASESGKLYVMLAQATGRLGS